MEPWLTGKFTELHPIQAALLYSFEHAREDLGQWTAGLTEDQLWREHGDVACVGFHIRHLAGSVDRLLTYAAGMELSEGQLRELSEEKGAPLSRDSLFAFLDAKLSAGARTLRTIQPEELTAMRYVGRKKIAVPLGVLLVHIAEHTQRHVGAAIVTAKLARSH